MYERQDHTGELVEGGEGKDIYKLGISYAFRLAHGDLTGWRGRRRHAKHSPHLGLGVRAFVLPNAIESLENLGVSAATKFGYPSCHTEVSPLRCVHLSVASCCQDKALGCLLYAR